MDDDEKGVIERLQLAAQHVIERLEAAKLKYAPLRDAVDRVLDEIRKLREQDPDHHPV